MLCRLPVGYSYPMHRALPVVCIAGVIAVSGCGLGPSEAGAVTAARDFYGALQNGDGGKACARLSAEVRHKLMESEGTTCAKAVTSLQLSARSLRRVEVYGRGARVVSDSDTAFAARFADGWHITAAGCKERAAVPYDCELEG